MIFDFDSAEEYTNFICETVAPPQSTLSNQSQEVRNQILRVIIDEVANKCTDKTSGSINISNEVICMVGRK